MYCIAVGEYITERDEYSTCNNRGTGSVAANASEKMRSALGQELSRKKEC